MTEVRRSKFEVRRNRQLELRTSNFALQVFCILFFLATGAHAAIPQSQRDALLSIYNSTGGPQWTNSAGWLAAPGTECGWFGVACDETQSNVIGLDLYDNNLTGPFPAAVGSLPRLRYLFVWGNQLTGPIPATIGALTDLEALFAARNALTGTLPRELASLTKLERLGLDGNAISGTIPREVASLTALRELTLSYNDLTGPIPAELAQLANLEILSLAENELSGSIPPELGRLQKLEMLGLSVNRLTGSIPPQLADATALKQFHASYNQLEGAIPPDLARLRNLEELVLNNNRLTGTIPPQLGDLSNLKRLELTSNLLAGEIPRDLFRLAALESLALGDNDLTGAIPREIGALKSLQVLALYANEFSGAIPIEITALPALTSLELQTNELTGTIPPELSRLTALTWLDLSGNALTGTIPRELGTLSKLEFLALYENQLDGTIPPELGNLTSLTTLYLGSNRLTGTIPDAIRNLKALRALSLAGNALTGEIPQWIGELTDLDQIFLGANKFTGTIPASVGALEKLAYLDLSENEIGGSLPDFTRLRSLVYLRIEYARLTGPIPASIGNATELADIYLAGNRLSGPLPRELSQLTKLATLALSNNSIEGTLPPDLPPSLVVLSLWGNRLGGTIPKEIGRLTNLQFLDLALNAFRGPVPVEITQLTSLEDGRSDFAFNGLFATDPGVAEFLARKHYDRDWLATQTVKPANVRVTGVSDRSATLQWDPIAYFYDGGGYQVIASKTPGGPPAAIATTTGKELDSITIRNLEASTTYYFTVATVTHPHPQQDNLIVSDPTDAVSAATTARVIAPPDVVVTESTTGLVQIGGVAANEDSFTLTNFGDSPAQLSIAKDGDFFTLEADAITIAGGASRTIKVRSVTKPVGTYYGGAYVIGDGASEGIYIPVVLLSVAQPAGTVIAEPVETRIEIAGVPGSEQVGTARFRNAGTAPLHGVVIASQPWVVPAPEPITIEPGQTATVTFRIIRSRRTQAEGAETATLSLVYVDGVGATGLGRAMAAEDGSLHTFSNHTSPINISTVTIVDVSKPPVTPSLFGVAPAGEVAMFIPGVASLLRGSGAFGSDLSILNASSARSVGDLRLYFALAGGAASVATLQPLASNQNLTLTNVVANVYNVAGGGSGTLQVRSAFGENLNVLAKLTSLRAAGTFSGEIPVFRADRAVRAGEKIHLAGLRRTTDLIVQETTGAAATVRIEMFDASGAAVATPRTESLAPLALLELRDVAPASAVTAIVTNVAGSAGWIVAYARVTDDASGDTWSIVDWSRQNRFALNEPVRVPLAHRATSSGGGGRRRAIRSNAVAQSTSTDLTLFNPTAAAIKVQVDVISASARVSSREIEIGAMQTIALTNAVNTSDAATAHVVLTPLGRNAQVVATARTRGGAAGTAVPILGALEGLRVGQAHSFGGLDDSTSATIAAASPATFTTSYGFVETAGEPVRVRARLFLEKERSVVTATVFRDFQLPARGQILVPELVRSFAGDTRDSAYGDLHGLRLQIEVMEGKGAVVPFVLATDNGSGDVSMRIQ